MMMIGSGFNGSIIGGVQPVPANPQTGVVHSPDYQAMSFMPTTGAAVPDGTSGAVAFNETFQSAALTLAAGLGIDLTPGSITGGQVVSAALVNG
jgi:hypothetical protein